MSASAPWLDDLRVAAAETFEELGTPTNAQEAWRYANVAPLAHLPLPVAPRPSDLHFDDLKLPRLGQRVFLADGHFFAEPSTEWPEGVTVMSLAAASAGDHPAVRAVFDSVANPSERSLTALNTAAHQDGLLVDLADRVSLDEPLHLIYLSRGQDGPMAHHPRVLVRLGRGTQLRFLESYLGSSPHILGNAITEVVLADDAQLEHVRLSSASGTTVAATSVAVGRDAQYRLHAATIGSTLAREETDIALRGPGARASLGGLLLGRGDTTVDHHVRLEHAAPDTESEQLFHTILDEEATGNFAGKVVVQPNATRTNARQSSRALLLSPGARANAKPQLEIYTDDVRCTHGATSGQLDDEALFYLRARGIDEGEARRILTEAFAGEWLERIGDMQLRNHVRGTVRSWLQGATS
jgi:Fe-S cluster assembly protein SufD